MNVQSLPQFGFGFATLLASKSVSFAGFAPLDIPVVSFVFNRAPKPICVFISSGISRFSLPLEPTIYTTKHVFPDSCWKATNWFTTIITNIFLPFYVLNVIPTRYGVVPSIFMDAFSTTKRILEFVCPVSFSSCFLTAISAWLNDFIYFALVSTTQRTIFLARMRIWNDKFVSTRSAFFISGNAGRTIGALSRTKLYNSICSRMNWFTARLASVHEFILPYIRCLSHISKCMGLNGVGLDLSYQYLHDNARERIGQERLI